MGSSEDLALIGESLAALGSGDWDTAHYLIQSLTEGAVASGTAASLGSWLHAHLHKLEGDVLNSHYWYSRSVGCRYEDYSADSEAEAIANSLAEACGMQKLQNGP